MPDAVTGYVAGSHVKETCLMQSLPPDCRGVIVLVLHPAVVWPHENDSAGLAGGNFGQV